MDQGDHYLYLYGRQMKQDVKFVFYKWLITLFRSSKVVDPTILHILEQILFWSRSNLLCKCIFVPNSSCFLRRSVVWTVRGRQSGRIQLGTNPWHHEDILGFFPFWPRTTGWKTEDLFSRSSSDCNILQYKVENCISAISEEWYDASTFGTDWQTVPFFTEDIGGFWLPKSDIKVSCFLDFNLVAFSFYVALKEELFWPPTSDQSWGDSTTYSFD